MGREIRRVPENWEHPRNEEGGYQPLFDESFEEAAAEWKAGFQKWESDQDDFKKSFRRDDGSAYEFWEGHSSPPDREYYRPNWKPEERTHYQMYETTSEGSPISPVFATPEEVARWCADNGASAFGRETASYEAWLRIAKGGYAPSAVFTTHNGMQSGVTAMNNMEKE